MYIAILLCNEIEKVSNDRGARENDQVDGRRNEEAGREVPEHPLLCIPPESLSYEIDQGPIQDEHRSLQEGQVLQEGHE